VSWRFPEGFAGCQLPVHARLTADPITTLDQQRNQLLLLLQRSTLRITDDYSDTEMDIGQLLPTQPNLCIIDILTESHPWP